MLTNIKKRKEGFTIIEVLIVLAIAGLILLIVFLAVPALQRNQRNTARKNDVARIGGATAEFISNNNGTIPTTAAHVTTIVNSAGTLSQYVAANVSRVAGAQTAVGGANALTTVRIVTGARCGTGGATVAGAARQVAIQYATETSGGATTPLCQDV